MSQHTVILLLGTNLGDKEKNLIQAQSLIIEHIGAIESKSEIIETEAEEFESNHLFLNQSIKIQTTISPMGVLKAVKIIEKQMGRIYLPSHQRFQDRIIDIDLLFFDDLKFDCQSLTIPHPQIKTRKFIKRVLRYNLEL